VRNVELDEIPPETLSENACSGTEYGGDYVPVHHFAAPIAGVRIGVLVGLRDDGGTPLVMFVGQPDSAAVPARATLDLHGQHVGRDVALMFEEGDASRPVILGCFAPHGGWPPAKHPGRVDVETDGSRLVVSARERLVLSCGKATITLTRSGKVLIQGTYVSSRSSGVNRIKGGSVQLN
jgi:hypothetical protein